MKSTNELIAAILQQGFLPLYYHPDEQTSVDVLKSIYRAGIRVVEYTSRGETAPANFVKLLSVRNEQMPDMLLGIGTIKSLESARDYMSVGADFLVSPGFIEDVADYASAHNIFYVPGCMTPGEIMMAENAGIRFIKLFPGNILGPEYLKSIRDIFPEIFFMPTGGVDTTKENIESWFNAGVSAVGMGGRLLSKSLMDAKAYDQIEIQTKVVAGLISKIKNQL